MVINFREVASRVEFRSVFRAPSRKFKILANPNVLAHVSIGFSCTVSEIQNIGHSRRIIHGKSYEHDFTKKLNGHIYLREVVRRVEFRSVFHVPSWKFKILAIPNVLAHGKLYENGFTKKRDGHQLCAKSCAESSFDMFLVHRLENSKYWPFLMYYPMVSRTSTVLQKNSTVIYFARIACRVEFRSFFHAPSQKFKILGIPKVLAHGKSFEHGFTKTQLL
ncbi:hypothetical protein B296_00058054 [Ensete ventricosum]|uniref:Uncharacterized protein n=1 Tax=Ensete ventricosum TaxID=4639 RepID=A0A426WXC2_ENSVE|nr:hypothetical protein B296_00058054 [Ensete ventricosum]